MGWSGGFDSGGHYECDQEQQDGGDSDGGFAVGAAPGDYAHYQSDDFGADVDDG